MTQNNEAGENERTMIGNFEHGFIPHENSCGRCRALDLVVAEKNTIIAQKDARIKELEEGDDALNALGLLHEKNDELQSKLAVAVEALEEIESLHKLQALNLNTVGSITNWDGMVEVAKEALIKIQGESK